MPARAARGAVALAMLLGACQAPPAVPPAVTADPAAQAAAALDRGDYARAVDLYRQALGRAPESLPLHYGLGVAASHLDLKDEAIREFRWVLERGAAGSPEVEAARRWLASVGALPRAAPASAAAEGGREPGNATLEGRALSAESGQQPKPIRRHMLILAGQPNSPTQERYYRIRTDEDGRFRFPNVVPGPYMLTDRVAGRPLWRLRIELGAGQRMTLDLTPANSARVRDDFPNRG